MTRSRQPNVIPKRTLRRFIQSLSAAVAHSTDWLSTRPDLDGLTCRATRIDKEWMKVYGSHSLKAASLVQPESRARPLCLLQLIIYQPAQLQHERASSRVWEEHSNRSYSKGLPRWPSLSLCLVTRENVLPRLQPTWKEHLEHTNPLCAPPLRS